MNAASTNEFKQLITVNRINILKQSIFTLFIISVWIRFEPEISFQTSSVFWWTYSPKMKILQDEIKNFSYLNKKHILRVQYQSHSMHRNTRYISDIIRTIKIIAFLPNHKAPHYIRCAMFRAKAERHHCQHIKLTAIFHYKSHPERQLYIPKLLWTQFSSTMPHSVACTSQLYHS